MAKKKTTANIKSLYTCKQCKHCTPYTLFRTLSLKGEPTMGTCPYWTTSKCVLLNHDTCEHFAINTEYSGITGSQTNKEVELQRKKEILQKIRQEFSQNNQPILQAIPCGKPKKRTTKKKK